ncbi:YraN family protein [Tepidiforma sp.]|uniref:YraN family protein n=1 Tax=Tepidiforma sp. TaxID=2682230 RepID=UPI00262DE546|nr:YraN family protein [Tepidiforma sp.]MCX7618391.1 YraN family protein [Tepidiforma sp.]
MTERRRLGDFGERVAAHRLEAAGMAILGRNLRIGGGEIDLLARDGGTLVFVEVRTRRGAPGLAAESVDAAKVAKLLAAARAYCEREGLDPEATRLDVVAVDLDAAGRARAVRHFRGIEAPGL